MKKLICGILLFISALIWGITFVAQSDASAHIEPFTFNFVRFLIGSAVLLPFIPIFGRFEAKKQRTALRLIQPRQLMKKQFKKAAYRRHSFGHHALHCLKFAAIGHYKRRLRRQGRIHNLRLYNARSCCGIVFRKRHIRSFGSAPSYQLSDCIF